MAGVQVETGIRCLAGEGASSVPHPLRLDGSVGDACHPKYALVALHLFRLTQCFLEIVGELHRPAAIGIIEFANQTDRTEAIASLRVTVAKIIRKQCAPSSAEANT